MLLKKNDLTITKIHEQA